MRARARVRAYRHRDRERQRLLESAREAYVGIVAPRGFPDISRIGRIIGDEAEARGTSSTSPSAPSLSAATLSALVMRTTCAASYQIASPVIPCSFPAAVCAVAQCSQALAPLTTAATTSFSPPVNSPGPMVRLMARPGGPPNSGSQAITRLMERARRIRG